MKKSKIPHLLLLLAAILLCSCASKKPSTESTAFPTDTSPDQTTTPTSNSVETEEPTPPSDPPDDSVPPQEGMKRSRLTNEWVSEEVADTRPIAVMTPNEISAIPHYNLSQASVLYEANVEGRMTRMLAVYENWWELERIGNVRSLRSYYDDWATEWDAVLLHYGATIYDDEFLSLPTTQDLDGNAYDGINDEDDAYFRATDRSAPHNGYAYGPGILNDFKKRGYSLTDRGLADETHYQFTNEDEPNTLEQYDDAVSGTVVDMSGCYPVTRCRFEYNEEDGLYYRYQRLSGGSDGPHVDAVTGEQLTFTNILIQNMDYGIASETYLYFVTLDTTQDGWFFTKGRGIHVTWEKTTQYGATRYYDDDGNEITLNTGKTMVLIVEDGDVFNYE
ncbi:MAG: DUF3048 domain-containing protein [Clostridium sp.]|jgi:hypothetical protein|nr:DUF3048 domain-containing protein [Clostridium sp.]